MGHILGALGGILVGLIVLGGAAGGLYSSFSKSNVGSTEENLILTRMQIQQFYAGTNYEGLTNEMAIKAGLFPKAFLRGTGGNASAINSFGGAITLEADTTNSRFSIKLDAIPQEECVQLARFQSDAWDQVDVNGTTVIEANTTKTADPTTVSNACQNRKTNYITYYAR